MNEQYLSIIKEVQKLFEGDYNDLPQLRERLMKLENLKYRITNYLIEFEADLLTDNLKFLNTMLDDGKRFNKVLSSSTLTKDVLNAKNVHLCAKYRKMQEYLRNIRGSITSTITLISLEKNLVGISSHTQT